MKAIALLLFVAPWLTGQSARKPAARRTPATKAATVADKFPLRRIQVKGNHLLTAAQIQSVAGLPLNQPLGKADFDAARDRLLATNYFESVAFQFGPIQPASGAPAYEAVFDVVEVPSVYPVQFENLPLPISEIEADLKANNPFYGAKVPGTEPVLAFYARRIERFLASRNHPDRVMAELTQQGPDEYKILFHSATALPPVEQVLFTGNQAVSSVTLRNAINSVAYGVPFSREHFRQLLDHQVRPLYEAKGLIRVAFPVFTTEPAPKVKGVVVHVTVEEGPVYNLSKISLVGADPDYQEYIKMKPGSAADFDQINETLDRLKKQMKHHGYLDVEGVAERQVDDKAHTVEVVLRLSPGPEYTMGKLTIEGLDLNSEPVVRKLWATEAGKPFNSTYPDYFLTRIKEDGLFDGLGSTKATTQIDENRHIVDVTLTFGSSPKPKPRRKPGAFNNDDPLPPPL